MAANEIVFDNNVYLGILHVIKDRGGLSFHCRIPYVFSYTKIKDMSEMHIFGREVYLSLGNKKSLFGVIYGS